MNRIEFMAQLERLLFDVPENDRNDAIAYYNGYFDEAGIENEAKIVQELGSPGKVAAMIKADMNAAGNRGEFTERGYQDGTVKSDDLVTQGQSGQARTKRSGSRWALLIILIVFASPILLGVGGGLLGGIVGILAAIVGLGVGVIGGGAGIIVGGITAIITGVIECFTNPATGFVMMGGGMLLLAVALLLVLLAIILFGRLLPKLFRSCVNVISRFFHREKRRDEE